MKSNSSKLDGNSDTTDRLRMLPSVDSILNSEEGTALIESYGRDLVLEAVRGALDNARREIATGTNRTPEIFDLLADADRCLKDLLVPTLRPVINASGVIVHTNLGRAPISSAAIAAIRATAATYSTLEYNLAAGERGSRAVHAEKLLTRLTGAEAALVVNNNAAALLLMLTAICQGKEVIISRGQLVEIGGGFRVPDVMAQSGAILVEVGTTNRTHLKDYEQAISDNTAALLIAHHSNYKIIGFTSEPNVRELATLAHNHQLPLLYDQGSGALLDTEKFGMEHEPTIQDGLLNGADVIGFSGDKLVGGPQAGILCGRAGLIKKMKRHPLARAVRADKMCLAALSATLSRFLIGRAVEEVPVWRMISRTIDEIELVAHDWAEFLSIKGLSAEVFAGNSTVGGGSIPGSTLPTRLVAITHMNVTKLASDLRNHEPPVIARIMEDRLLLDPRTVLPGQEQQLLGAIVACS